MIVIAKFWAQYRGHVNVEYVSKGESADEIAAQLIERAIRHFGEKFTFPARDQRLMRCVWVSNGKDKADGDQAPQV